MYVIGYELLIITYVVIVIAILESLFIWNLVGEFRKHMVSVIPTIETQDAETDTRCLELEVINDENEARARELEARTRELDAREQMLQARAEELYEYPVLHPMQNMQNIPMMPPPVNYYTPRKKSKIPIRIY